MSALSSTNGKLSKTVQGIVESAEKRYGQVLSSGTFLVELVEYGPFDLEDERQIFLGLKDREDWKKVRDDHLHSISQNEASKDAERAVILARGIANMTRSNRVHLRHIVAAILTKNIEANRLLVKLGSIEDLVDEFRNFISDHYPNSKDRITWDKLVPGPEIDQFGKMSGQIFISYRRKESRWAATILRDRLRREFDAKQIFMDIDGIELGEDFVEAIKTTVAKCAVLIALIGKKWLTLKDGHRNRRLDNPEDFVRMEIGAALKRKIRVIPVLVDGALMPQATDLPEDLKPLVRRHALAITYTTIESDSQLLVATIRPVLDKAAVDQQQREKKRLKVTQRKRGMAGNNIQIAP